MGDVSNQDGYITPPPGLLPPARAPEGVPEHERVPAVPGGLPLFTPNPGHTTGPTVPTFRPPVPPAPASPAPVSAPEPAPVTGQTQQVTRPDSVPAPTWALELPDGSRRTLAGATFVGRNPTVTDAAPGAGLLPLADPAKSLSKTHALLVPELDYLMVTDLHSTNGIAAVTPDGAVTVFEPGRTSPVASGSTLQLGSFAVTVERA